MYPCCDKDLHEGEGGGRKYIVLFIYFLWLGQKYKTNSSSLLFCFYLNIRPSPGSLCLQSSVVQAAIYKPNLILKPSQATAALDL